MTYLKKPIPPDSVLRILADAQEAKNARTAEMPTEQDAIDMIQRGYSRLKDLGWRDGMYMPKDGTTVTVMQVGSTGQFDCSYSGEWADGFSTSTTAATYTQQGPFRRCSNQRGKGR